MKRQSPEAVYELSPQQVEVFLFHQSCLDDPGEAASVQLDCLLRGELDTAVFRRAWQRVLERHPVLRSSFGGQGPGAPRQTVHRLVEVPLEIEDWCHLSPKQQEAQLRAFLDEDRCRGFDLATAPLLRLTLFHLTRESYRLAWRSHLLILDSGCVSRIRSEVMAVYGALRQGQEADLPPPRPYREYVVWLRRQDLSGAEHYWRRLLAGSSPPVGLAVERCATATPARVDYERRQLLSKLNGTTMALDLSVLVQGAWALLLSRYSGRRDVVFGTEHPCRPEDFETVGLMFGLLTDTLPMRVSIPGESRVGPWLRALREQQTRSRQELAPFSEIRAWSPVPWGMPPFESLLSFQSLTAPSEEIGEGGLTFDGTRWSQRTCYPLNLVAAPWANALSLEIGYETRRFDATTIQRVLRHLETLLCALAAGPEAHLDGLALLSAAQESQLLLEYNDTRRESAGGLCVHQLFEAQAARTPQATAVFAEGREVTFRELNQRAECLALGLRELGVGAETLVGIGLERSLEMVVGMLAVLKAGGAFLPLDPAYPRERLALMLSDSGTRVVLTRDGLRERFAGGRVLVDVATLFKAGRAPRATALFPGAGNAASLAYVIYTSGSTGRPKGVMVEHRCLADRVLAMADFFPLGPGDRQLQFASMSFDMSCEEIFVPLASGAALVLESQIHHRAPAEVLAECGRLGVTKLNLPASYWHQLVDELERLDREVPDCLEILATGAESLSPAKLLGWLKRARRATKVFNSYGPSEATIMATTERLEITPEELAGRPRLPIGRPLPNTEIYLVDAELQPLPVGVAGQLLVGGVGVTRGYLNRPALSAERFLGDPFGHRPGGRLYQTGDLARYLSDGRLEFLGRADLQVKLRGWRIELEEIEELLRHQPGGRRCRGGPAPGRPRRAASGRLPGAQRQSEARPPGPARRPGRATTRAHGTVALHPPASPAARRQRQGGSPGLAGAR